MSAKKPTKKLKNPGKKLRIAVPPLQNAKHEAVLQAYFADPKRVGFKAYLVVYPKSSDAAAKTAFSRLLKNADFAGRLKFLDAGVTAKVVEKTAIDIERVVNELAKIGFASMKSYFRAGEDGVPRLRLNELNDDELAAIAEITSEEEIIGGQAEESLELPTRIRRTKFKLHNKQAALVNLLDHLGGFPARKHELAGEGGGPIKIQDETPENMGEREKARRILFLLERAARAGEKPKKGRSS